MDTGHTTGVAIARNVRGGHGGRGAAERPGFPESGEPGARRDRES